MELAHYLIENRTTVRAAAKKFGVSKSTVHKDLSERLPLYDRPLYLQVKAVMEENKAQRHIRGGLATRKKYKGAPSRDGAPFFHCASLGTCFMDRLMRFFFSSTSSTTTLTISPTATISEGCLMNLLHT